MNKALGENFGGGKESHLKDVASGCLWLIYFLLETEQGVSLYKRFPIPGPQAPFSASQVCSADMSQLLPDTMDAHDLPRSERMCPLPLASVKSPLLACPEGLDLCLCALQKTPLGRAPRDLREDTSNISESAALGAGSQSSVGELKGTQVWGCRGDWDSVTGEDRTPGTLCCLGTW